MSLTCHEEIGHVGRVGRGCYTTMLATCPQQVVRVVLVEFGEQHDTRTNGQYRCRPPADQSGMRVASWTGKSPNTPDTRDILVASYEDGARVGHVREDATEMLRGNCSRGI